MEQMKLILAGSFKQYMRYLQDNGMRRREGVFISNPSDLLGIPAGLEIVEVGEFKKNPLYGSYELSDYRQRSSYVDVPVTEKPIEKPIEEPIEEPEEELEVEKIEAPDAAGETLSGEGENNG